MELPKIYLAPHHITHSTPVHPAADVFVGAVWAGAILGNLQPVVTTLVGILAGIYYCMVIYDRLKEKKKLKED